MQHHTHDDQNPLKEKHFKVAIKIYFNICFFYFVDKFLIFKVDS